MKKISVLLTVVWFCLILMGFYVLLQNTQAQTFTQTKKELMTIYAKQPHTFYCHCIFDQSKRVHCSHSSFTCRNKSSRCKRVEFDHIYPAYAFGHTRECWKNPICQTRTGRRYKGRACCEKVDKQYAMIEADPHNLVPVIGQINDDRRDYFFGALHEKPYQYGSCQVVIDRQKQIIQPPSYTRGWIARDYFYMHKTYGLPLTTEQIKLYAQWDKQYPPTKWESRVQSEDDRVK